MPNLAELRQELEWRRCKNDERYFLAHYFHIAHPERGRILFDLRPAQQYALAEWRTERYSLTLKARQIGWSTLVAGHQFWLAFFQDDRVIIDISRTEREAVDLLAKTKYGYKHLPEWMRARGPRQLIEHQQRMSFANGSSIESMPSASDPARGKAAFLIVVDEWAFLPNAEDAWASIAPVADVGGRVIGLSTANGSGNWFHNSWVGAETGTNKFHPMFAPWNANGDRNADWYEAQKKIMQPWALAQEYPNTPEEAFIKSGNPVFDLDVIAAFELLEPTQGDLYEITKHNYQFRKSPKGEGTLRVWELPQTGAAYVFGADVAEGLEHGDYSSAHVLNLATGEVAAIWHGHTPADIFGEELYRLGLWYNAALAGVESNNHGLTTLTVLRRLSYPRIYRERSLNNVANRMGVSFGFKTTAITKPLLIDELGQAMRLGAINIKDRYTIAELRTFVRDEKARMHGSPHDDRVISLGLAVQMLKYAHQPEYRMDKAPPTGSLGWWEQLANNKPANDGWVLGQYNERALVR